MPQDTLTYITTLKGYQPTEEKQRLVRSVNCVYRCREEPDPERLTAAIKEAKDAFASFRDSNAPGTLHPEWALLVWESIVESALLNDDKALELSTKALELATTAEELGVSHTNLADDYLRLGDYAKAEEHARKALAAQPTHAGYAAQIATTLAMQNRIEEAALLLFALKSNDDPKDIVNLHLRHEKLLRDKLPEIEEALYSLAGEVS